MTDGKHRLVIADDHRMFREGLRRLLEADPRLQILAEVDDGDQLLLAVDAHQPDVAIIDVNMPGPGIHALIEHIEKNHEDTRSVALTMHMEAGFARELLSMGLHGYVVKDAAFEELTTAIDAVANGDQYLCSALLVPDARAGVLTERETECLRAAARGGTAKGIGRNLGISERTVRFHFSNVCQKLGVQRRSEAVAIALRNGMIAL